MSSLSASLISVESYDTDEEGVYIDRDVYYQHDKCSEVAETVKAGDDYKPTKQIGKFFLEFYLNFQLINLCPEYTPQKEQCQQESARLPDVSPLGLDTKGDNEYRPKPSNHDTKKLYDFDSDSSSAWLSLPIKSSLIAHTGHSMDNMTVSSEESVKPATHTSTRRRRLRNLVGL